MKVAAIYNNGLLTISIAGELDHHAAKTAVTSIEENIDAYLPKSLTLNFQRLSFMDSSGIAVILKTFRRMNELSGTLTVENVPRQAQKVLDAAGLGRLVKITVQAMEA